MPVNCANGFMGDDLIRILEEAVILAEIETEQNASGLKTNR
jgi:hypothetical protein